MKENKVKTEIIGNTLNIEGNIKNITEINGIENLTQFKGLYCEFNQLNNFNGFEKFPNLEVLDLTENQITNFIDRLK